MCLVKRPKVLLYRFYSLAEFPDEVPEDDSENYDTITVEEMYGGSAYEAEGDDCIWKEWSNTVALPVWENSCSHAYDQVAFP